ncbi:MAG: cell division protein FtsZ [Candidatus Symbiothrix sp.]|jgi:cell division protein FtsZ|nr:cell division protein FtsZ [Candidatus Symbiothrix sp.]
MAEKIIFNSEDSSGDRLSILQKDIITGFAPAKPLDEPCIIKVVGVGGGGGNAVTHMYKEGIHNVSFALCNTDRQALNHSPVPFHVQLGKKGLGAGGDPEKAREAAGESIDDLRTMLSDGTEMVFITAGMGGGTGTGAAPVIARLAKEMGILTVGIVTIPFWLEGTAKILLALKGVEEIEKNVDALLVINNERLLEIYSHDTLKSAFKKADNILAVSARSIAEIITIWGEQNLDFADVNSTLRQSGVAIISSGTGSGENRLTSAIRNALKSPLLNNNDIYKAKRILLNIYHSEEQSLMIDEMKEIDAFMSRFTSGVEMMKWGSAPDENLGKDIKITILASGFDLKTIATIGKEEAEEKKAKEKIEVYYPPKRGVYPKPFIFTSEDMNDNPAIEAILNQPAYKNRMIS